MKIPEIIICKRCGHPTNRHPTAKYCFLCMNLNNQENNRLSHIRNKKKKVSTNENNK